MASPVSPVNKAAKSLKADGIEFPNIRGFLWQWKRITQQTPERLNRILTR